MLVLSLDTTTRPGSVALVRDGALLECVEGDASRSHAERLPGEIASLLARHAVAPADIDAFGVAAGPGSFTGLRIGIATIQGLAFATGRPVVAVSALDALAVAGLGCSVTPGFVPRSERERPLLAAWIDAHRREVFAALYGVGSTAGADAPRSEPAQGDGEPPAPEPVVLLDRATVGEPDLVLDQWASVLAGRQVWFVGDGALVYRHRITARSGFRAAIVDPLPPLAPVIAKVAARRVASGDTTPPHAVRPIYVRRPDAELARDHRRPARPRFPADQPS